MELPRPTAPKICSVATQDPPFDARSLPPWAASLPPYISLLKISSLPKISSLALHRRRRLLQPLQSSSSSSSSRHRSLSVPSLSLCPSTPLLPSLPHPPLLAREYRAYPQPPLLPWTSWPPAIAPPPSGPPPRRSTAPGVLPCSPPLPPAFSSSIAPGPKNPLRSHLFQSATTQPLPHRRPLLSPAMKPPSTPTAPSPSTPPSLSSPYPSPPPPPSSHLPPPPLLSDSILRRPKNRTKRPSLA